MDARPNWRAVDIDGCLSGVDIDPTDHVSDVEALDLVLTAGITDRSDEAALERRRQEYRELFNG